MLSTIEGGWLASHHPNNFEPVPGAPFLRSVERQLGTRVCFKSAITLLLCSALFVLACTTVATPTSASHKGPAHIPAYTVATVQVAVADVWRIPYPRSDWDRETQVLLGERVLVLQVAGEWTRLAAPDQPSPKDPRGYPGWVRSSVLTDVPYNHERQAVIMVRSAPLKAAPDLNSVTLLEASLDTRLGIVRIVGDWIEVALPAAGSAWLLASWTRVIQASNQSQPTNTRTLIATAQQLVGVRYLWGGTHASGMDCSGFTYRVFHANGILLPRDSEPQSRTGRVVSRSELQPGDLIFYADGGPSGVVSHVGLYIGDGRVLHASSAGSVRLGSVWDIGSKAYWGARRY